jgi:hypothetical protein
MLSGASGFGRIGARRCADFLRLLLGSVLLGALHRDVPGHTLPTIFRALFDALVAGIAKCSDFVTMQQSVRLRDTSANETGRGVHSDMRLHAKVPVIAALGLMHSGSRSPFFLLVDGEADQPSVNNRTYAHHQPLRGLTVFPVTLL